MATSSNLENLAKIGHLKAEPPSQGEIDGLIASGRKRLKDAKNPANALESRFDLAYGAAHAFSLAALRRLGYRSESRYLVFQALPHTLGMADRQWRLLALCHERRNKIEYEGIGEVDESLVAELVEVTEDVLRKLEALGPVEAPSA
jgi:hypothetical protein